jgi:hypothetical protein
VNDQNRSRQGKAARRARDGNRVVCCTCSITLCTIIRFVDEDELALGSGQAATESPQDPVLWFEEGWLPDDGGTWRLTRHAEERVRRGKRPAARRPAVRGFESDERRHLGHTPARLPAGVKCWKCGTEQVLDPKRLGVALHRRDGWSDELTPREPRLLDPLPESPSAMASQEVERWMKSTRARWADPASQCDL